MWIPEWVVNTIIAVGAVVGLTMIILVVERWWGRREGWVRWKGGPWSNPIYDGSALVQVKFRNGAVDKPTRYSGAYDWHHTGTFHDIVAYRILKG